MTWTVRLGSKKLYWLMAGLLFTIGIVTALFWLKAESPLQAGFEFNRFTDLNSSSEEGPPVRKDSNILWHGAEAWHQLGYKGEGIKVGVIDTGFYGFGDKMGTELPPVGRVFARCHPTTTSDATKNISDCEWGFDTISKHHGTTVSLALVKTAPEITLYISNPQTNMHEKEAVDWMIGKEVNVISYSRGHWLLNAPGDGIGDDRPDHILKSIDRAINAGILWVTAAGNDSKKTWYGPYKDLDEDERLEFFEMAQGNGVERNIVTNIAAGANITMRYADNWPNGTCDLDFYLEDSNGHRLKAHHHPGSTEVPNNEKIPYRRLPLDPVATPVPGNHYLQLRKVKDDADPPPHTVPNCPNEPQWIQIQMNTLSGSLVITHHEGEITLDDDDDVIDHNYDGPNFSQMGVPAQSNNPGHLTVGAANYIDPDATPMPTPSYWNNTSKGPAITGEHRPDITAVCGSGSCGTSFSALVVAGLAALVLDRYGDLWAEKYTAADLANWLRDTAEPQPEETPNDTDPNNIWGAGYANLPSPAPAASITRIFEYIRSGQTKSRNVTATNVGAGNAAGVDVSVNHEGDVGSLCLERVCGESNYRKLY